MRKSSPLDAMRRRVRRELWGADDPVDLNAGVHLAAEFIEQIVRSAGLAEGMAEERLREIWSELVGEYIAKSSNPVSLKQGVLAIRVAQPAMKFHLEQMRGSLLAKIQKAAANDKIKSIRFTMG